MTFQLRNINPEEGFGVLVPFNADFGAGGIAPLGDINGDGLADISISSGTLFLGNDTFLPSREYFLYGTDSQIGPFIDPAAFYFRPDLGFVVEDGGSVDGVGDIDADGIDDWTFTSDGQSFIISGSQAGFPNVNANNVASIAETTINGALGLVGIGDVNGDGLTDIAGYLRDSNFVIHGRPGGFPATIDPAVDADTIFPDFPNAFIGLSPISPLGDFNGDGFDDALIDRFGEAVVIFGSADGLPEIARDVTGHSTLGDPSRGFVIERAFGAGAVGDVNDDGFDDIAFAAITGGAGGNLKDVFVLFGTAEDLGGALSASDIDGENGAQIIMQQDLGLTPNAVGDVNGDGVDDFMIGTAGNGIVLFGGKDAFRETIMINYRDIDHDVGVEFEGFSPGDDRGPGFSGVGLGDFNGDGVGDLGVMPPIGGSINTDAFLLYGGPDIGRRPEAGITVHAGGTGGPELRPEFDVYINGSLIGSGEISDPQTDAERRTVGTAYDSFVFNAPTFSEDIFTVDIVFANDGRDPISREDANLFIDKITVSDVDYEAEVSGFFTPDNPGAGRAGPREALWWNGTLTFDLSDSLIG